MELSDKNNGEFSSFHIEIKIKLNYWKYIWQPESHNQRTNVIQMFKDMLNWFFLFYNYEIVINIPLTVIFGVNFSFNLRKFANQSHIYIFFTYS